MLQQGSLFDNRYVLTRFIGRGGFAEVWLVNDNLTGLEEALKIYAPGGGMDEDGLKLFAKELSVVHDMHHSNLLTPKMLGQCDNQPYLIMSYCPNGSLNKKVGNCTEEEAWKILEQVASGLAYLHQHGIVHQDIKPDNILVDAHNDCVITDFGISLKAQSTLRKSMRIQANSGTMAYMAPERFSAEPHPIPANDVWSLGAMMFELIEGSVPFLAQMGGLAQMNGAQLPTMHAGVGLNLKQVIISMLAADATTRPTAAQVAEMARSKSASVTAASTPQPSVPVTPQPSTAQPEPADGMKTQIINPAAFAPKNQEEQKPVEKVQASSREDGLKRNGFITFWLWLMMLGSVISGAISFYYVVCEYELGVSFYDSYTFKFFSGIMLVSLMMIIGVSNLLSWMKSGFWLVFLAMLEYNGFCFLIYNIMFGFLPFFIEMSMVGAIFAVFLLWAILHLKKEGRSCWSQLK